MQNAEEKAHQPKIFILLTNRQSIALAVDANDSYSPTSSFYHQIYTQSLPICPEKQCFSYASSEESPPSNDEINAASGTVEA
jgi:hypothetical protein